ncbi:hypothetical protein [Mycolicibacterium brisbanense]
MANELHVDATGLRAASVSSDTIAGTLSGGSFNTASSSQPSSAGIAAVNAALASVRGRHANRITGQAGALTTGGARYDTTDGDGADAVTTVSV